MAKSKNDSTFDVDTDTSEDGFEGTAGAMFENAEDGLLVDLSGVKEQSFEVLPKGTYDIIIEEVEYGLSKSSGKPMWNMKLAITSGEYENRKLFTFLSFSEKALPGTKTAIGKFAPELLAGPFSPQKVAEEGLLVGKKARVKVKIEAYEGEDRNRVQSFLAALGDGDGFVS